jgi:predicted lysophospholipase L1 biosynthesis ABC-type transport system permease subunit
MESATDKSEMKVVPEQADIPWGIALRVCLSGMRRRFARSLITMTGVVLAIAFLCYMRVTGDIVDALIAVNIDALNVRLQRAGIDIQTTGQTSEMMMLLIGLSLLACLVGIVNAMLMAVTERTREIGTLKCLGAPDNFIIRSYFIESMLQGIIGTLTGVIVGVVVALSMSFGSYGSYVALYFPWGKVLFSLAISFFIGALIAVIAAVAPAYWAARREPVDAMRVEE